MDPSESEHEDEKIERLRRAMYSRELSKNLKERPRRRLDEIRSIVGEDWKDEEAATPSSSVAPRSAITFVRTALWWVLGLAMVFFVGAIGFFAYYFTLGAGASPVSAANIDISISGPPQISGGEPAQIQIAVTNRNQIPLQLADLIITYPSGTRSPTDLSTDLSSQRISLGTIEPGGRRQGTVSAVFAGDGTDVAINVDLEYRISGSSAIFFASSEYMATLSSSPIALSIKGNTETVSGQPIEFIATLSSNANTTVKDVLLSISYPFGFTPGTSNPKPTRPTAGGAGNIWEIGDIEPGRQREVVLRGSLTGEASDERVFRFEIGTRKTPSDKSITTKLAESPFRITVSEPFLSLSVSANKSTGSSVVVAPAANVNVTVSWQNNLSAPIQDAVIVARLSGIAIDGSTVVSPDGFYRSSDGVVIWDKSTTKGVLSNLAPGAKGSVSFTFRMPTSDELKNIVNPTLTFTVNAAGKRVSEKSVPENLQSTAVQRISVSSDFKIKAQGLYYANPFTSVGPLPPKAGTETTYGIVFTLTNTTNKIENAKLSAALPPYVRWIGIFSPASENLTFNQNDSTVEWDIGNVEPGVGMDGTSPRQSAIAIGFTPSTSQIGQAPPLLQNITFSGVDSATGQVITRAIQNVTTNIIGDPGFSATNATVVR